MKVCYFGNYDEQYPRHYVLMEGLRRAGVEVFECHLDERRVFKRAIEIVKKVRSISKDTDVILVGFSNSRFVWFLRLLTRKPIVWNGFYSLYDNWVHDRKRAKAGSPRALFLWLLDFLCAHAATKVILETNADIAYWVKEFKVPQKKFVRIFVGYNEKFFTPHLKRIDDPDTFIVEFHGGYIPVQGVEYIIRAAKLLEEHKDIRFNLIGDGQTYKEMRALEKELELENVNFIPKLPMEKLAPYLVEADVCIGLVGTSPRVNQAIPNKVYEASGMQRASINADTDAIRELFVDHESIILVERGNARAIADAILELKNNPKLKDKIARNAYKTVNELANIERLGQDLHAALEVYNSR